MKPLPSWLPGPYSRKWHSRQLWDNLGYLRVRTLANPNWHRDIDWLIRRFVWTRSHGWSGWRPLTARELDAMDRTIRLAKRYKALLRQERAHESDWDAVLAALDDFLWLLQQEHLRSVDAAGVSGRPPVIDT